jgi:hypothetical protein
VTDSVAGVVKRPEDGGVIEFRKGLGGL